MKRVTFTVGLDFDKEGNRVTNEYTLSLEAKKYLALLFGGITTIRGQGSWLSPTTGSLISEDSLSFITYTDKVSDIDVAADFLRELYNQEAVMVVTEVVETVNFVTESNKVAV